MQEAFQAGSALTYHILEPFLVFAAFFVGLLWPILFPALCLLGVIILVVLLGAIFSD